MWVNGKDNLKPESVQPIAMPNYSMPNALTRNALFETLYTFTNITPTSRLRFFTEQTQSLAVSKGFKIKFDMK